MAARIAVQRPLVAANASKQRKGNNNMGGQNHQPTSPDITPASAWLSRKIGEAIISVQQANNHLEDAIMLAMRCLHITDLVPSLTGPPAEHLDSSANSLRLSLATLEEIDQGFTRLFAIAKKIGYAGNPLATSVRKLNLQSLFDGRLILPRINDVVWTELLNHIEQDNILATLEWERLQFRDIAEPTRDLIATTEKCRQIALVNGDSAFADAVETNLVPFRQYYARVFSLWNHHHDMFLYSALVMTELFYRANGFASLADFDPVTSRVKAA